MAGFVGRYCEVSDLVDGPSFANVVTCTSVHRCNSPALESYMSMYCLDCMAKSPGYMYASLFHLLSRGVVKVLRSIHGIRTSPPRNNRQRLRHSADLSGMVVFAVKRSEPSSLRNRVLLIALEPSCLPEDHIVPSGAKLLNAGISAVKK